MTGSSGELYVHERYKDSKEAETDEFERHAALVVDAQRRLAEAHGQDRRRVFHAKPHGCLAGRLTLRESRPDATRQGIFGPNGKSAYNVLARFSGGVGFDQHDLKPDVRGLALKIFGAGAGAVDFLMTNGTNPFGADQEEFVQFMRANVDGGLSLLDFLKDHKEVAGLLLKTTLRIIPSLATEQYWSGHPYLLGPRQAMKFNVRPSEDAAAVEIDHDLRQEAAKHQSFLAGLGDKLEDHLEHWRERVEAGASKLDSNYLTKELQDRLRRGPIRFVFSVQLEKDERTTPIENTLVEWKESDSPSIPVADLVLDRDVGTDACKDLRFTPGHCHPDHRPLGNMGRGRLFTYRASQGGRGAAEAEPEERRFFGA
jgi:hypothetical protein